MKRFFLPLLAALTLTILTPAAARAEAETYDFDKPHTQVIFFASHMGFSRSEGKFLDYSGHFTVDRLDPEKSTIDVSINTASINMDDEKWDAHMKNADFFDVEKFPVMTFKSTSVKKTGDNTADVTGDLTIKGIAKPVTLHVTHNKSDRHPFSGKYVAGFSAKGTLKRSDFGITYGLPAVGDEIELIIEVEGIRRDPEGKEALNP